MRVHKISPRLIADICLDQPRSSSQIERTKNPTFTVQNRDIRMDVLSPSSITARIVDTVTSGTLACMEGAAQLSFGQTILRFIDRFLWIVEKSAQWSLPCPEETAEENGRSFGKMTLVRPLPWIFFLPGLMLLRVLRVSFNIGAFIVGYSKLEPCEIVKYVQKSRRRLRTIKTNGLKSMRQRKDSGRMKDRETKSNADAKWRSMQLIRSIQLTLSSLSCLDASKLSPSPPPVQIKICANHESTPTPEEKSTTESASSPMHVESKRKYSQVSSDDSEHSSEDSEEETVQAKIDRIASLDESMDDEDFNPADLSNSVNDSSSSLSTSGESSVSASEIQDIQDEANMLLYRACAGVAEVITEEPEPIKRAEDGAEKRTGQSTKFENPNADYASENYYAEESQEFHSPCKFGEEGDTAFYSPISSKSSSPDRTVPAALEQDRQQVRPEDGGAQTKDAHQNGELKPKLKEPQISGAAAHDKTTNGHAEEKGAPRTNAYPTKTNKPHYKGRRTSNASRKKK